MRGSSKADGDEEPAPWLSAPCMAATRGASREGVVGSKLRGGRHRHICCLAQKLFLESLIPIPGVPLEQDSTPQRLSPAQGRSYSPVLWPASSASERCSCQVFSTPIHPSIHSCIPAIPEGSATLTPHAFTYLYPTYLISHISYKPPSTVFLTRD